MSLELNQLRTVPGIGADTLAALAAAGYTTLAAIAEATPAQLAAVRGVGPAKAQRLRVAADAVPAYADELDALPSAASHGDASTNNLLVRADTDELTLIDFGFWTPKPLGFDIRQLLIGEVQLGRRPAADLPAIDAAVTAGYLAGVRDEGDATDPQAIRRCHALCLLLYSGLSLFPWEQLGDPSAITPEQVAAARERAAATRFCLDLAEAAP